LFTQLSLLGLLLSEYFINILHDTASLMKCRLVPLSGSMMRAHHRVTAVILAGMGGHGN
jgi:hypothetical protein